MCIISWLIFCALCETDSFVAFKHTHTHTQAFTPSSGGHPPVMTLHLKLSDAGTAVGTTSLKIPQAHKETVLSISIYEVSVFFFFALVVWRSEKHGSFLYAFSPLCCLSRVSIIQPAKTALHHAHRAQIYHTLASPMRGTKPYEPWLSHKWHQGREKSIDQLCSNRVAMESTSVCILLTGRRRHFQDALHR